MAKAPSFPWYPDDWLSDEKARLCSLEARGLWMDMLCLMHKSDRRGYLQQANGQPFSQEQLARLSGCTSEKVAHLLRELIDSGTASVTEHGIIFSRRMMRDEQKRSLCSEAGRRGGGNPAFKGHCKGGLKVAPKVLQGEGKGEVFPHPPELKGGVGENCENARDFELSPESLAQLWIFRLRRKSKFEELGDVVLQITELLRLGKTPEAVQSAIQDDARDRGEYFWQLKDRLNGKGLPKETTGEMIRRHMAKRKPPGGANV